MAANQDFIFTLGADISEFSKSITEVRAELNRVKNDLKNKTGQAIVETNQYIQQLEGSLDSLNKVGLKNLGTSANGGTAALFSLGQVARDLPFGFIAIQNNLPLVVDQFTRLSKESGGLKNAFGQVLNAISGPAGFAFAFGALTSITTALVQQYGSLSNALGQIFGTITRTKIALDELEKSQINSTASGLAEARSIDNLIKILNDSKEPYATRLGAYEGLKNIMPDVISALDKEKTINGDNATELSRLADIKKQNIILDGTRQALIKAIEKETENALTKVASLSKQDFFGKMGDALKGMLKGYPSFIAAQMEALDQANQSVKAYDVLSIQLDGVDKQIAKNTGEIDKQTEAYKRQTKEQEKANAERDKAIKKLEQERIEREKARKADIVDTLAHQNQRVQEFYGNYIKRKKEELDLEKKLYGFRADATESFKNLRVPTIEQVINPDILKRNKQITDQLKAQYSSVKNIIEQSIREPLDYIFNTLLEGGKLSWKDFGKVVVKTLANVVTQIIATAIAIKIADVLTKGAYSATVRLADKATGGGKVGSAVGLGKDILYKPLGLGSRNQANFSGINGGGMALSGQVVMVQRGSDLVGVINRTNTIINKVG